MTITDRIPAAPEQSPLPAPQTYQVTYRSGGTVTVSAHLVSWVSDPATSALFLQFHTVVDGVLVLQLAVPEADLATTVDVTSRPTEPPVNLPGGNPKKPKPTAFFPEGTGHRAWPLSGGVTYLDTFGFAWRWDGQEFDKVAGPDMLRVDSPLTVMPLLWLAKRAGLHSVPADAAPELECLRNEGLPGYGWEHRITTPAQAQAVTS